MTHAPHATPDHRSAVDRIVQVFETIAPDTLPDLEAIYAPDATFRDPFNAVQGQAAIRRIFAHMFVALDAPRFVVTCRVVDGAHCFLTWEFRFRFLRFDTRTEQCILGGTHLQLAPDGRIQDHRDYWDAAEELYEKLPVIGGLMRWLKRRANS